MLEMLKSHTFPKTTCLPSSQGVGAVVMKNCTKRIRASAPHNHKPFEQRSRLLDTSEATHISVILYQTFLEAPGIRWC